MVTIQYTFSSLATPQVIDAYLGDWRSDNDDKIFVATRKAATDYAKRNAREINQTCSDGLCHLEDIASGAIGFAEGFIAALDYLCKELEGQLNKDYREKIRSKIEAKVERLIVEQ